MQIQELSLQRQELAFQGQQIERQSDAIENQLELLKRQHEPILVYEKGMPTISGTQLSFIIYFKNMGGPANYAEVSTTSPNISGCNINPKNNIDDGQVYNIGFNYSSENDLPATIKLTYSDLSGKRYTHEGFLGVDEEDSVSFFNNHSSSPSDKTTVIKN